MSAVSKVKEIRKDITNEIKELTKSLLKDNADMQIVLDEAIYLEGDTYYSDDAVCGLRIREDGVIITTNEDEDFKELSELNVEILAQLLDAINAEKYEIG